MRDVTELLREMGMEIPAELRGREDAVAEIRLRSGRATRLHLTDGGEIAAETVTEARLRQIALRLMDGSYYSRENDLREGYFTARGGFRVGVCGKLAPDRGGVPTMEAINALCIRIARERKGCATEIARDILADGLQSALILSPPGFGKTTLIRDLARIVSDSGRNVAIADERGEIAACVQGTPALDVGTRTDVMDGCPKAKAIPMLIRACAPELIVADEIGGAEDAQALTDAVRCGVRIAATAHADSFHEAAARENLGALIGSGLFFLICVLGGRPGKVVEKRICRNGAYEHVQGTPADFDYTVERGGGTDAVQRAQTEE